MKKAIYLATLMFAMVLMNTSCEKPDDPTPVKTLEQQFPDWKNLTWVETRLVSTNEVVNNYAEISIKIVGDVITFTQKMNDLPDPLIIHFTDMELVSGSVYFSGGDVVEARDFPYQKVGSQILLTEGLYKYVLKIN
jgi:hypothetical protein